MGVRDDQPLSRDHEAAAGGRQKIPFLRVVDVDRPVSDLDEYRGGLDALPNLPWQLDLLCVSDRIADDAEKECQHPWPHEGSSSQCHEQIVLTVISVLG